MTIAIDVRTACGEKTGKGWYTYHLVLNLLKIDSKNEYTLYTKAGIAAFEGFSNVTQKIISTPGIFWHFKVIQDIKKNSIDLFFAPSSYIIPAFLPKNIKSIVTVHDLVAIMFPKGHNVKAVIVEKLLIRRVAKKSKHLLPVSESTKKDLHNKLKCPANKMTTIYCSASDIFHPVPRKDLKSFQEVTNLPSYFFLAVGSIIPRKNHINLIKAFSQITRNYPKHHLIIVGKPGWKSDEVFDAVEKYFVEDKVHFLNYVASESLLNLYNLATALVFPSFYEGFGIPPLEAMKSGCPVITSYTSSLPEVVGDAAILLNPQNTTEIATAMQRIIENPELAHELSEKGLKQAKDFSWKKSAEKLLKLINKQS